MKQCSWAREISYADRAKKHLHNCYGLLAVSQNYKHDNAANIRAYAGQ
jgi:hypothetical protein